MAQIADQWKANGDCSICRRRNYCKTTCTACKDRAKRIVAAAFRQSKAGRMMSAMKQTMNNLGQETEYLDE